MFTNVQKYSKNATLKKQLYRLVSEYVSGAVWLWMEGGADFLKVGVSWFSLAPRALHHRSITSTMPTARNLTAYLARIHVKHI